jgi:hypothetical protein
MPSSTPEQDRFDQALRRLESRLNDLLPAYGVYGTAAPAMAYPTDEAEASKFADQLERALSSIGQRMARGSDVTQPRPLEPVAEDRLGQQLAQIMGGALSSRLETAVSQRAGERQAPGVPLGPGEDCCERLLEQFRELINRVAQIDQHVMNITGRGGREKPEKAESDPLGIFRDFVEKKFPVWLQKATEDAVRIFPAMARGFKGPAGGLLQSERFGHIVGGVGGIGEAAGAMIPGPAGVGIETAGKLVRVMGEALEKLRDFAEGLHQANMRFARISPSMSVVQAEHQMRQMLLDFQRGQRRAEPARDLSAALDRLNARLAVFEDFWANAKAKAATIGLGIADVMVQNLTPAFMGIIQSNGLLLAAMNKLADIFGKGKAQGPMNAQTAGEWAEALGGGPWFQAHGRPPWMK